MTIGYNYRILIAQEVECLRCILSIDIEYVVILFRRSERWCKSIYQEKYTQLAIWLETLFFFNETCD